MLGPCVWSRSLQEAGPVFLTDIWYFACLGRELKAGAMTRKTIVGEPIVIGRTTSGEAFALRDICPHRGAPLSAGRLVENGTGAGVQCPYHGWTFRTSDGTCSAIPALVDEGVDIARIRAPRYRLREAAGLVWIYMPSAAGADGEPQVEPLAFEAPGAPRLMARCLLPCHADHGIVGLVDPAHGPYVHQNWWWRSPSSMHEKAKAFHPSPYGFTMTAHRPSSNSRAYKLLGGTPTTEIVFQLPGVRVETTRNEKSAYVGFTAVTPVDETHSEMTQVVYWKSPLLTLLKPFIKPLAKGFLNQDGRIFALQSEGLKHDPNLMLLGEVDEQARWYFRLKKEWAAHRAENRPFENPVTAKTLRWRT
ncbi:MAG: aromatic ring-hydroxylating dioxygenase subunit alpha [Caulobacterales bacterium]|nr:aromatic ring-hydroxylating dioxygenase subunit alpha [Caulobacterales bacterium]